MDGFLIYLIFQLFFFNQSETLGISFWRIFKFLGILLEELWVAFLKKPQEHFLEESPEEFFKKPLQTILEIFLEKYRKDPQGEFLTETLEGFCRGSLEVFSNK